MNAPSVNPPVLTVRQPWASAIIESGKDVENRTWPTLYRGPLLIHAAGSMSGAEYLAVTDSRYYPVDAPDRDALPIGEILGVVDVVGCHQAEVCNEHGHHCSRWAMPVGHHWRLENPRPLEQRVPAKGRLGFWRAPGDLDLGGML